MYGKTSCSHAQHLQGVVDNAIYNREDLLYYIEVKYFSWYLGCWGGGPIEHEFEVINLRRLNHQPEKACNTMGDVVMKVRAGPDCITGLAYQLRRANMSWSRGSAEG